MAVSSHELTLDSVLAPLGAPADAAGEADTGLMAVVGVDFIGCVGVGGTGGGLVGMGPAVSEAGAAAGSGAGAAAGSAAAASGTAAGFASPPAKYINYYI